MTVFEGFVFFVQIWMAQFLSYFLGAIQSPAALSIAATLSYPESLMNVSALLFLWFLIVRYNDPLAGSNRVILLDQGY